MNLRSLVALICILGLSLTSIPTHAYQLNFSYINLESKTTSFSTFQGKLLLVEVFSTVCIHCQAEAPTLSEVYNQYSQNVTILSLSSLLIGGHRDTIPDLGAFKDKYKVNWEMGLDIGDAFGKSFSVTGTPTLILFDQNGAQIYRWASGETPYGDIAQVLDYSLSYGSSKIPSFTGVFSHDGGNTGSVLEEIFKNPVFNVIFFSILVFLIYFKAVGGGGVPPKGT